MVDVRGTHRQVVLARFTLAPGGTSNAFRGPVEAAKAKQDDVQSMSDYKARKEIEDMVIIHCYYKFMRPDEITQADIEGVIGEPNELPWEENPCGYLPAGNQEVSYGDMVTDAIWDANGTGFAVFFAKDGLGLTCDVRPEGIRQGDAAFMSEARSALAKRLGIVWVDYEEDVA